MKNYKYLIIALASSYALGSSQFVLASNSQVLKIYYLSQSKNSPVMYSQNLDGSDKNIINSALSGNSFSLISSDSKILFDNPNNGISISKLDGSDLQSITTLPGDTQPAASLDNKYVVFIDTSGNIDRVNIDGTNRRVLLSRTSDLYYSSPTISPDSKSVAFVAYNNPAQLEDIDTIPIDGGSLVNLTNNAAGINSNFPSYSPDGGKLIFYQSTATSNKIITMPSTGGQQTTIISSTTAVGSSYYNYPRYSPDGTRLVLVKIAITTPGGNNGGVKFGDIAISDSSGNGITVITSDNKNYSAQWGWENVTSQSKAKPVHLPLYVVILAVSVGVVVEALRRTLYSMRK